jgi:hypothetical protein
VKMRVESRLVIRTADSDAVSCQLGQWPIADVWHDARRSERRSVMDQYFYTGSLNNRPTA